MTESTIDIDRAMQGIDCEVITWTKCSERMPQDKPVNPIIVRLQDGIILRMSARWFLNVVVNRINIDVVEWAPYTPEAWAELNKKYKISLDADKFCH